MREIRSSGSVEGVVSNHDPYSDFGYSTIGREPEFAALFNRPDLSEFDPSLRVEPWCER
jgi:hypothetical protein